MTPNFSDSAEALDLPELSLTALTGAASAAGATTALPPITPDISRPLPAFSAAPAEPASPATVRPAGNANSDQERDIWLSGYSGRAALPGFFLCVLMTAVLAAAFPTLKRVFPGHGELWQYAILSLTGSVWVFHVFCSAYRTLTIGYRLTSRRFFYHPGCLYPGELVIDLDEVVRVEALRGPGGRLLGVGRLRLVCESGERPRPPITLMGVRRPAEVAHLFRQQILHAREARVRQTRIHGGA
jgi:hypothetical protein